MKTGIDAADNNGNTCCFVKFFLLTERIARFQNSFNDSDRSYTYIYNKHTIFE